MPELHTVYYTWRPARGNAFSQGRPGPIRSVVLHSTCGREEGDLEVLTGETPRRVSVHWYINRHGKVYHLVADADTAWHAGRVKLPKFGNAASVGIEMEHFDPDDAHPDGEDWPEAQVEQAARVCAFLLHKHCLTVGDIYSHQEIAFPTGRKSDPVAFPWTDFHTRLQQKLAYEWQALPEPAG